MRSFLFVVVLCVAGASIACSSDGDTQQEITPAQRALAEEGLGSASIVHQTVTVTNAVVGLSAFDPTQPIAVNARGIAGRLNDTLRGRCGEVTLNEPAIVEVKLGESGCAFDDALTISGSMTATVVDRTLPSGLRTVGVDLALRNVVVKGLGLDGDLEIIPMATNLPPLADPPRSVELGGKIVAGSTILMMEPPLSVSAQSKRVTTFREVRVVTPSRAFGLELWGPSSVRGECFPSWGTLRFKTDETHAFVHLNQETGITGSAWPVPQSRTFETPKEDEATRLSFPSYGACSAR